MDKNNDCTYPPGSVFWGHKSEIVNDPFKDLTIRNLSKSFQENINKTVFSKNTSTTGFDDILPQLITECLSKIEISASNFIVKVSDQDDSRVDFKWEFTVDAPTRYAGLGADNEGHLDTDDEFKDTFFTWE